MQTNKHKTKQKIGVPLQTKEVLIKVSDGFMDGRVSVDVGQGVELVTVIMYSLQSLSSFTIASSTLS